VGGGRSGERAERWEEVRECLIRGACDSVDAEEEGVSDRSDDKREDVIECLILDDRGIGGVEEEGESVNDDSCEEVWECRIRGARAEEEASDGPSVSLAGCKEVRDCRLFASLPSVCGDGFGDSGIEDCTKGDRLVRRLDKDV
jgi:hypothetical protein